MSAKKLAKASRKVFLDSPRAAVDVGPGHHVRVIETEPRRLRHERDPAHAVRRYERCAFLGSAVDVAWDHLPVPVHELRRVGVIVDIDGDSLSFLESQ